MLPLVEQLAATWTSLDDLCADLSEDEWRRPTGCPGWTVQDNVAHLCDYEAYAVGRPRPQHEPADAAHVKNDMGRTNEVGVDARRRRRGSEVLDELRELAAERLVQLGGLTADDLEREVQTPIGPGSVRDLLQMRLMDTWSHEQDIRRALGRPGHVRGAAVESVLAYWFGFLPLIVAKRAGAPDGTTVAVHVGDVAALGVGVVEGRGRPTDLPTEPTVVLRTDPSNFAALVGGRSDADPAAVDIAGDEALGRRIVDQLGFLP
jgi:uncharacterized protein (TIGR03083 family)